MIAAKLLLPESELNLELAAATDIVPAFDDIRRWTDNFFELVQSPGYVLSFVNLPGHLK